MTDRLRRRALFQLTAILSGMATAGPALARPSFAARGPSQDWNGRVAVPGGAVAWKRVGGGAKTPLLVLHGGPGAGHNYLLPLAALGDERAVIFYDQLGCGGSDAPRDATLYTVQRSVEELAAVRRALGLERVILFGNAWGGMLAIEYLCQTGCEGIEKLILSGTPPSLKQALAGQQRLLDALPDDAGAKMQALEALGRTDSDDYQDLVLDFYRRHVCRVYPWPTPVQDSIEVVSRAIAYQVMNGPNEFTITGTLKGWDRSADLNRITAPTLITTGEFDEVTRDCAETLRAGIKGSEMMVFANLSHMTMDEAPDLYCAALRKFIV